MSKIHIIAHTWEDIELTIESFDTEIKCLRRVSEILVHDFRHADPSENVLDYIQEYYESFDDIIGRKINIEYHIHEL
jgi:hypothetical protein